MKHPHEFDNPACRGSDTESFFPGKSLSVENLIAKKICSTCPEMDACLEWGLHHESHGIWGGMTNNERNQVRRRLNIIVETPHLVWMPIMETA